MYKHQLIRVTRSLTLASLAAVLVAGIAGVEVAGASPEHHSTFSTNFRSSGELWFKMNGHDHGGHDNHFGNFGLRGQVTAVSATSLTVQGEHGTPVVLSITPTTTFMIGSSTATASALAVGERVLVQVSPTAPNTATQITIALVKVEGLVSAVSPTSLTLSRGDGWTFTVAISPSTTFSSSATPVTLSAVTAGVRVEVQGIMAANNTIDATNVNIVNANVNSSGHAD